MRIVVVTESFLPTLNGVTTSVCRVLECLTAAGHRVSVVCPRPAPAEYAGAVVHAVPSVPVRSFPTGIPTGAVRAVLEAVRPDVVHVASPFVLGARALREADELGIPSVAVYQTDMPSYLAQHAPTLIGPGAAGAAWRWVRRVHDLADLTLAPSTPTAAELAAHGVRDVARWGRGVDTALFHPDRRTAVAGARGELAPDGEVLVGYVGRLAPEKELGRLVDVARVPGTRLVVVGDGPSRARVAARLAEAVASTPGRPNRPPVLLGQRSGEALAQAYGLLDVFVHTGTRETFGQTLQEAHASGLPVVAPARGGPLDLVEHGRTGLLADPDRAGDLADRVRTLVLDPGLRARMGRAGRAAVEGRTWASLTEELLGHYRAVAGAHPRRRVRRAA
ncbi:glycosyltransferase family 1 protein [Phycicoccus endophyticus]|uniref:D-inositol 3-phosphate glycosyltransferase n=1 Tax=Phycicoccus endophyticus TaxID=1690220 RepID=A0A7G9R2V6_9MICO|nr:glycosyltransferase family 1 protein [Phycicoccus endophyticus]QNN49931.1 glycosyltransferase family 1 protein [Phycicoccus endophyticus]GGL29499.1 GDP-mannose-dependent alpha-mannosyltransferase [Phycicoccus endophyticus]